MVTSVTSANPVPVRVSVVPPVTDPDVGDIAVTSATGTGVAVLLACGWESLGATVTEHPVHRRVEVATMTAAAMRRLQIRGLADLRALLGTTRPSKKL
ncbi:hypothetical protein GCM10008097_27470 [Mycetocola manganoxydans]|nr:hypothetical protein GCM10008097_27470 [Mycetocola manganoxydans]